MLYVQFITDCNGRSRRIFSGLVTYYIIAKHYAVIEPHRRILKGKIMILHVIFDQIFLYGKVIKIEYVWADFIRLFSRNMHNYNLTMNPS